MTQTNTDNKTEERKNRFTGESIMLTKEESIIHDRIFINELGATIEDKEAGIDGTSKLWDKVRKDINYFRQHNAEAYMVLLDYTFLIINNRSPNGLRYTYPLSRIPIQYQHRLQITSTPYTLYIKRGPTTFRLVLLDLDR